MNTPIYYKADINAEQLKQIAVCLEELERVIELQEIFREAADMCLDKESRPDKIMSERLCEFMAGHPEFGDATVKMQPFCQKRRARWILIRCGISMTGS